MKKSHQMWGEHDFWPHFWFGFVFAALVGGRICWDLANRPLLFISLAALISTTFGFCCGRWGDSVWEFVSEFFQGWRWW